MGPKERDPTTGNWFSIQLSPRIRDAGIAIESRVCVCVWFFSVLDWGRGGYGIKDSGRVVVTGGDRWYRQN